MPLAPPDVETERADENAGHEEDGAAERRRSDPVPALARHRLRLSLAPDPVPDVGGRGRDGRLDLFGDRLGRPDGVGDPRGLCAGRCGGGRGRRLDRRRCRGGWRGGRSGWLLSCSRRLHGRAQALWGGRRHPKHEVAVRAV